MLWPTLREHEFVTRTDRIAWRHVGGHIDLVELTAVGSFADAVGATSSSFGAHVASVPTWHPTAVPMRKGKPAPHYWHCDLSRALHKTLRQPWFEPFARPQKQTLPASFRAHRDGLMRVLRRERHDRPDIWYVLENGTNVDDVVRDLLSVVISVGLPLLNAFHDPAAAVRMVEAGELSMQPESPAAWDLEADAHRALA